MFNTQKMSNRQWAESAIGDFQNGAERLLNFAINLPPDLSDGALEFADILEAWAWQLERAMREGRRGKRVVSEFRHMLTDSVLLAIDGYFRYLESLVDYGAVFAPEHYELD